MHRLRFYFCLLLSMVGLGAFAQGSNPFDLKLRLTTEQPEAVETEEKSPDSTAEVANPFDLTRGTALPVKKEAIQEKNVIITEASKNDRDKASKQPAKSSFLFYFLLFDLLLFSVLVASMRGIWTKVYRGVMNDNMLSLFYGERYNNQIMQSVLMLYSLFFVNMSLFLFLIKAHTSWLNFMPDAHSDWRIYAYIFTAVFIGLMLKHLVLRYIGFIFPLKKETGLYNFSIIVFSIFISLVLLPLNITIAFIGEEVTRPLIILTLLVLVLLYALRYLRALFIANKLITFHKFHFLLYLCTVEIAPPLILYQLFINN